MRTNKFIEIYKQCNNGTNNKEKFDNLYNLEEELQCPTYIDIELTNYCNLKCRMCPTGTGAMERVRGFMSNEVIDKVCENLKKYPIDGVRLIRWGEPTLHKEFIEILKKLKTTGKRIHFNTNGSLLTYEQLKEIVDLEIDSVKFSFQGVDEATYGEMRYGGEFKQLIETIKNLHFIRGDKKKPYIQISTTVTYETEEQIKSFTDFIENYCDYYNVGRTKLSHLDINKMKISETEKEKILELREKETLNKRHLKICPEVYDKLSVNWNGDVTACCADYDNKMIVGNIFDNDLHEIFTNEKIKEIRKIISNDEYDKLPICSQCFEYIDLQKED